MRSSAAPYFRKYCLPSVPQQRIAAQLPAPKSGVLAANAEILRAVSRQRLEPGFNLSKDR